MAQITGTFTTAYSLPSVASSCNVTYNSSGKTVTLDFIDANKQKVTITMPLQVAERLINEIERVLP